MLAEALGRAGAGPELQRDGQPARRDQHLPLRHAARRLCASRQCHAACTASTASCSTATGFRRMLPYLDFDECAVSDPRRACCSGAAAPRGTMPWSGALRTRRRRRGVDIVQNCEVTGIAHRERPRDRRRDDARPHPRRQSRDRRRRQHLARSRDMAGLRLPIESHVLQAFVSEGLKPLIDRVITFGAGHFYISQSDKGGLVFGGDIDGYNSYAQRGNLPHGRGCLRRRHGADADDRAAARAALLGRRHGHVDGRLADHRPDADRGALSQCRLVLRRLQGDARLRASASRI